MTKKFRLLLISIDGEDFVTESNIDRCGFDSVEDAIEFGANLGSKWYFYPFQFVIIHRSNNISAIKRQRIVDACPEFAFLEGRTVSRAMSTINHYSFDPTY